MSDLWRKTLVYLGLTEEPEDHEGGDVVLGERMDPPGSPETPVRDPSSSNRLRAVGPTDHAPGGGSSVPTVVPIVQPETFEEAEQIGDRCRSRRPVLLDLRQTEPEVARRLLDFVSGTLFALGGRIASAGSRAFLQLPDGTDVSEEERGRLAALGYELTADDNRGA
jgi:cell division inhibitor SepF